MKVRREHITPEPKKISISHAKAGGVYRLAEYSLPSASLFLRTEMGNFVNIESGILATITSSDRLVEIVGEFVPSGEVL